jgi:hypothetical protein
VLLDAYTRYIWTFPIQQKSDVFPIIMDFFSYVQTQFGLPILALQTNNGKEYDTYALHHFLSNRGVVLRLSCPNTSQQNGKAERVLRTLNDCVRTMLIHNGAPLTFWAEALQTATYLLNRRPCRTTGITTSHELLLSIPPNYDQLRVFGCLSCPNITATTTHKFSLRSLACVFISYPNDHRGYRCYDIASRRVITSHHVIFDEHHFPFRNSPRQQQTGAPQPTPVNNTIILRLLAAREQ